MEGSHRLTGCRDILAIKEGAGPILHRVNDRDLWVPATSAAVERDTAAGRKLTVGNSLPATYKAILKQIHGGSYA